MTRQLPWLKGTSTTVVKSSRSTKTVAPRPKRRKVEGPDSGVQNEDTSEYDSRRRDSPQYQSSPPTALEPPSEIYMYEGLDKDDRFRMVEDEFLDAAKQFTQYLHAAEYQRMKRAAKSQNAATISSISRPVTVKMPDETRRKVEGVARSKRQTTTLKGLLTKQGRASGKDEESDDHVEAWLGTALHGLMESPRRSGSSLTRVAEITTITRAVAGYSKSRHQNGSSPSVAASALPNAYDESRNLSVYQEGDGSETSCDDDDLDAPIRPRGAYVQKKDFNFAVASSTQVSQPNSKTASSEIADPVRNRNNSRAANSYTQDTPARTSLNTRERITKRLKQAEAREVEQQQEARKRLEIIPTFLS